MTKRIIPYQTKRYNQQQKFGWCGMYTLKNVIESFSSEIDLTIKECSPTFRNKISWFMFPKTVAKVLQKNWLIASNWRCKTKWIENKINFLKKLLKKWPIIVVVWHAYKWKKDFNLFKAISLQHYMSIRWYDDAKGLFYIYDSWAPKRLIKKDLPIWNLAIKYKDLIKYRKYWWFMIKKFMYISIDYWL